MQWWSSFVAFLKLPVKYVAWVMVLFGLLLFLPKRAVTALHLGEVTGKYGMWIGLVFLATASLTAINAGNWVRSSWRRRRMRTRVIADLDRLDETEKAVLREFYFIGRRTLRLPIDQPTVAGLLRRGVLRIVGSMVERSLAGTLTSIQIADLVADNLTNDTLGLPTGDPTEDDRRRLLASRPDFLPTLEHHENLFHRL